MALSLADLKLVARPRRSMRGPKRWSFRFRWRLGRAGAHNQWRERIAKVRLSDLLKWLGDFDGLGWPCRMHDEDDGSDAVATGIAAIAFADRDYRFIIGVDGRPGMLFQFAHRVPSVAVRRFPWEEKNSHGRYPVRQCQIRGIVML